MLYSHEQVENHIIGAPCGVMDQMASACGEANKLLAMVCQVCSKFFLQCVHIVNRTNCEIRIRTHFFF